MRLDSLTIKSPWKNLAGFHVDFDELRDVAVLIGKNGAAKSNLLEAIILIFRNIDLGETAPFSYELSYLVRGSKVALIADRGKQPRAQVDGKSITQSELRDSWSPVFVVGYYSGVSDRFEDIFSKHDLRARAETLVADSEEPAVRKLSLRRFICARPVHSLFALLAFYLSNDEEAVKFLREVPRIKGFDSALLIVRRPDWARKGSSAETFWGARGPVRDLLDCLKGHSLIPFARKVRLKRDFARSETRELLYLYLPDLAALRSVAAEYGNDPATFFQALDTMRLSGLIEDLRIRVKVIGALGPIHTRQLSEGEQQLLTVLGLMRFTRHSSSLYLLDEPDTHLNPAWSVEYLERLRAIGGIDRDSHTVLATHNPLLVAGLVRQEIRALIRSPDGAISAVEPEEDPRGTGVAGVLTSPLYGLESQLDSFSLKTLKRIYEVSLTDRSARRSRHLARLRKLLPALHTAETSPDPYRTIARDAYELAQEMVLQEDWSQTRKKQVIDLLASKLVDEASVNRT